jgi:hypothetical protein
MDILFLVIVGIVGTMEANGLLPKIRAKKII